MLHKEDKLSQIKMSCKVTSQSIFIDLDLIINEQRNQLNSQIKDF